MVIKKIYEIEERLLGGKTKTLMRCTDVQKITNFGKNDFYSLLGYEDSYHDKDEYEFLVCIEGEELYTLINNEGEIIHKGIPKYVNRVKKTQFFRIYYKDTRGIAIGSTTDLKCIVEKYRVTSFLSISEEWMDLKEDTAYYGGKLIIFIDHERDVLLIDIYYADDIRAVRKLKLNGTKVIARMEEIKGITCVHLMSLDENNFPNKGYYVSLVDGKLLETDNNI